MNTSAIASSHSSVAAFGYACLSLLFLALQMETAVPLSPLQSEAGTAPDLEITTAKKQVLPFEAEQSRLPGIMVAHQSCGRQITRLSLRGFIRV